MTGHRKHKGSSADHSGRGRAAVRWVPAGGYTAVCRWVYGTLNASGGRGAIEKKWGDSPDLVTVFPKKME